MNVWQAVIGIILFAVVTAILYVWGLSKAVNQRDTLYRNLMHACGSRVVKHLKRHETVSEQEIARLIEGVTVGPFYSRNKMKVQDGKKVAKQVVEFLVTQQYIEAVDKQAYRLKR